MRMRIYKENGRLIWRRGTVLLGYSVFICEYVILLATVEYKSFGQTTDSGITIIFWQVEPAVSYGHDLTSLLSLFDFSVILLNSTKDHL